MVCRDDDGDWYVFSFSNDEEDDIGVDICKVGKEVKKMCLKDWIDETRGLVIFEVHYISRGIMGGAPIN